jgi:hypothetical protein
MKFEFISFTIHHFMHKQRTCYQYSFLQNQLKRGVDLISAEDPHTLLISNPPCPHPNQSSVSLQLLGLPLTSDLLTEQPIKTIPVLKSHSSRTYCWVTVCPKFLDDVVVSKHHQSPGNVMSHPRISDLNCCSKSKNVQKMINKQKESYSI